MALTAQQVQQFYIGYYARPADPVGLAFWQTQTEAQALAGFAGSAEFTNQFTGLSTSQQVTKVYNNLLGRAPDANGLLYWAGELTAGRETIGTLVMSMTKNALGKDVTTIADRVTYSTAFTAAVNTVDEINAYSGATATQAAREALLKVVSASVDDHTALTTETAKIDATIATIVSGGTTNPGQTFTLTTGVDTVTGTAGNDTINATENDTLGRMLGGLDSIDGGAGTDTLNVSDARAVTVALTDFNLGGATIKNVEKINVSTNLGFAGLNVSTIAGLTDFTGTAAAATLATVTAADTTNVTLSLATTANSTVTGGKAVSVTKGDTAVGTLGVTGKALTAVTIKDGAGVVTINNTDAAATANAGTTLTAVTLDSVNADANVGGAALTTVNVKGITSATRTTTVTNATAGHALTINADGAGVDSASLTGAFLAGGAKVVDTVATALTINATGTKSSLDVSGSTAAKALTITGSAALTLAVAPAASVVSIDGSAATGALTLGTLGTTAVTVKTGSGNDSATLAATAKVTVETGAGNDTLSLSSAIAAGSTINLGAGNDKLLYVATGSVAPSVVGSVTTVDAGEGVDTVSALLINAGNGAQFKNFETIDASGNGTAITVDTVLLTGSSITGATLTGGSGAVTISNFAAGNGLTVSGANTGTTTFAVTGALANTADVFNINFDGAAVAAPSTIANITAGTVALANIETLNVTSGGAANTWNSLTVTDDAAKAITITGAQNLDLSIGQTVTATKVALTSIDGSAATGKLTITDTSALHVGSALTIKGGAAVDTIVVGASGATVTGGAGNDVFSVGAAKSNVTAGVGNSNTADLAGTLVKTVIADFTKGDTIALVANAAADTATFTATKVDVSAATNLGAALDLAAATAADADASVTKWFVWGNDSYVVNDNSAATTLATTDAVVKIVGVTDLSTSSLAHDATTGANVLTFA